MPLYTPPDVIRFQSGAAVSHTGDTDETTLVTVAIPPLRANSILRITVFGTGLPEDASAKTIRVKYAGTTFSSDDLANLETLRRQIQIANRNATNSQVCTATTFGSGGWGTSTGSILTAAIDSSVTQNVTITGQLADGTDAVAVQSYLIEVIL